MTRVKYLHLLPTNVFAQGMQRAMEWSKSQGDALWKAYEPPKSRTKGLALWLFFVSLLTLTGTLQVFMGPQPVQHLFSTKPTEGQSHRLFVFNLIDCRSHCTDQSIVRLLGPRGLSGWFQHRHRRQQSRHVQTHFVHILRRAGSLWL